MSCKRRNACPDCGAHVSQSHVYRDVCGLWCPECGADVAAVVARAAAPKECIKVQEDRAWRVWLTSAVDVHF